MAKRDIVVIGASAGGVYALKELATTLPAGFPASIFIVQHVAADAPSLLPEILNSAGKLKASHPADGTPIEPGHIYVAPPDHHLLVENDQVLVKKGPKENRFRPSIDALFRSAAYTYGTRVVGVVLTGLLDDGTSGMWSVKRLGGVSIIQRPEDALYPSMPENVQQHVEVDYSVPIAQLADLLVELTQQPVEEQPVQSVLSPVEEKRMLTEIKAAELEDESSMNILEVGDITPLTCPECHGSLIRIQEGTLIRFRCHTGHSYTAGSLLNQVNHSIEESLWNAIRALEETQLLLDQSAKAFSAGGNPEAAQDYLDKCQQAKDRSEQLRKLLF